MDEQADSTAGTRNPGRNLKACDLCRSRKVKCRFFDGDEACQGCRNAGVACTQRMIRRKRGPAKRSRVASSVEAAQPGGPSLPSIHNYTPSNYSSPDCISPALSSHRRATFTSATSTSTSAASPLTNLAAGSSPLDARGSKDDNDAFCGICSRSTLLDVLTDWAIFIWPMAPLLHKKNFLRRVLLRQDEENPVFCALVLSTCANVVSTHQRRWASRCPAITVERCIDIIERGDMLRFTGEYTVDWCVARYYLASSLTTRGPEAELRTYQIMRDAMAGVHWLLLNDSEKNKRSMQEQEVLKRLYWLMYMWQLEAELRGALHFTCLPSICFRRELESIRPRNVPDQALEVPEVFQAIPQTPHTPSDPSWFNESEEYVTGLNSLIDVALVWEQAKVDMTHREPGESLLMGMTRIQNVLDGLVPQLRWQGGLARFPKPNAAHVTQAINILITSLYIRSNLLQHLGPGPGITHHDIVTDVLNILDNIPSEIHEANGISLIRKVRDIGAAYLTERPLASEGPSPVNEPDDAESTVRSLLARLERLDSWSKGR